MLTCQDVGCGCVDKMTHEQLVARVHELVTELARLRRISAAVLKGVDDWNRAVQRITGSQPAYCWGALDELRATLASGDDDTLSDLEQLGDVTPDKTPEGGGSIRG